MISIMPCTAKKGEAAREQTGDQRHPGRRHRAHHARVRRLLRRGGINLKQLEPSTYDDPLMSEYSGAGADLRHDRRRHAKRRVRTMYYVVNGKELEHIEVAQLRGFETCVRPTSISAASSARSRSPCATASGAREKLVEAVLDGSADFDFIEIMACRAAASTAAARCVRRRPTSRTR